MKKWINIANRILLYGLFLAGVVLLFKGTGRISTMIMAFGSFIASVIIAWIFKVKKIDEKYLTYINVALWLNLLGEIIVYYSGLFLYDKILHITLGYLLSIIIYNYFLENSKLKKDATFFAVMGLLAVWEIWEFSLDTFLGFQSQGVIRNNIFIMSPIDDTMYDLIWGAIGSLIYLFIKKERADLYVKKDVKKIKQEIVKKHEPHYFRRVIKEFFTFG
jgi:hypothetical protein